jgi:parallel beta-helix repeat protein
MFHAEDRIGPYVLTEKLGQGQFGAVWLAEKRTAFATTRFALKLPLDGGVDLEAIRQEAKAWVAAIGHPNILPIIEADEYDSQIVIVSEYAPGGSLREWLKQHSGKSQSIEAALEMANGILGGLTHLHARGIIHRDLKPENILLQGDTPRIADFGIAKVLASGTQSQMMKGTPQYMAPEAFNGDRSEQTDIWSVGVMIYELLTGRRPFPPVINPWEQIQMIHTREPDALPATLPEAIRNIVARALKRDCAQRYGSASEMRKDLQDAMWQIRITSDERTLISPTTVIVSTFGSAHYRTISEAIKDAKPGSCIRVRPGIYNEGLVIDRRVEIVADGPPGEVIIESVDCCISMQSDYAIVRGFTLRCKAGAKGKKVFGVDISLGRLVLEDCDITSDSLACIGIYNATSSPIIRRCQIRDGKHSGIIVYKSGQGLIEDCDIYGNGLSGIAIKSRGNPTVRACKIHNAQEDGVHVYENGQGLIEDCDIYGNRLAGIEIKSGGNPTIRACKIRDGKTGGMLVGLNAQGLIEDCDIYGNAYSGVEIKKEGNPSIKMCRINRNAYQAVYIYDKGAGKIENCDLTENARGAKLIEAGCTVVLIGNKE